MRTLFSIVFAFLLSSLCWSQQPHFIHYSTSDGLPSNEVYETLQDDDGYLWIATDGGVSRFDGYEFKNYTIEDGLPENVVVDLFKDVLGRIWFVTLSKGICYYEDGAIHPYRYNQRLIDTVGSNTVVFSFYANAEDDIYISCPWVGTIRIDSSGTIVGNPFVENYQDDISVYIHAIKNDFIYEFFNIQNRDAPVEIRVPRNGRLKLSSESGSWDLKFAPDEWQSISGLRRLFDYQLTADYSYINLGSFIVRIPNSGCPTCKSDTLKFEPPSVLSILALDKRFLIATENSGIGVYSNPFKGEKPGQVWLKGESIDHIFSDREGGLWFSSLLNGLYYLPDPAFQSYPPSGFLNGSSIKDMEQMPNGNLYLMYKENDIIEFLTKDGVVKGLEQRSENAAAFNKYGDTLIIQTDRPKFMTYRDLTIGLYKPIWTGFNFVLETPSYDIVPLKNMGNLRLYNYTAVAGCPNGNEIQQISIPQPFLRVRSICTDLADDIWIACTNGLYWIQDTAVLKYDPNNEVLNSRINELEKMENTLLLASQEHGLVLKKDSAIMSIGKEDGLISNEIHSVATHENVIWCGTNIGLSRVEITSFNPLDFKINNYDVNNGLSSNSIIKLAIVDSTLFVGTEKGLSQVGIYDLNKSEVPPVVHIENVVAGDTSIISIANPELSHDQYNLSFDFAGLSFSSVGNVKYQYRLIGLNDDWRNTELRFANYDYLPPGEYTFEVMAASKNGLLSSRAAAFSFTILPPIWLKWWFIMLEILLGVTLVSLIFIWFLRNQKKRAQIELRIIRSEQMALQAQMNPHFMFNALNSIQSFNAKNEKRKAADYLSDFSKLIRKAIYNSSSSLISLAEEIRTLKLYVHLENMRLGGTIEFKLNVEEGLDVEDIKIPPMILQPIIENAIWHGLSHKREGDRKLKLEFSQPQNNKMLLCVVEDNGVGRLAAAAIKGKSKDQNRSIGLKNIQDRLELLNNYYKNVFELKITDLNDEDGNATGTRAELYIKPNQNYY